MPNLYTLFSNGTFESGTASFVFRKGDQAAPNVGTAVDSADAAFAGTKSLKILTTTGLIGGPGIANQRGHILPYMRVSAGGGPYVVPLTIGKTYRATVRVMSPSSNPIANDEAMVLFGGFPASGFQISNVTITNVSSNRKRFTYSGVDNPSTISFKEMTGAYVADLLDTWLEIDYTFRYLGGGSEALSQLTLSVELYKINENGSNPAATLDLTVGGTVANQINVGGILYVDNVYIDEVIGCNLAYGTPQYTKTNETGENLDDGTITVNATSSFAIQYRINGGAWQNSNVFTGLAPGLYMIEVQDLNNCTLAAINNIPISAYVPPACDVVIQNINVTDETALDADDGTAEIVATSASTLEYSLDGVTWQAGIEFEDLAPGDYTARVRKVGGTCLTTQPFSIAAFNAPPVVAPLQVDQRPVNSYNFISWFAAAGKINFNAIECINCYWDLPKGYRLNKIAQRHYPIVTNDEQFTFYINFDADYNYPNFSSLRLDLVRSTGLVQQNVAPLQRVFADDATTYFPYASVTLSGVAPGVYRLAIVDTSTTAPYNVLFVSQDIQVMTVAEAPKVTARFRFRNSANIYRVLYNALDDDFLQEIRLRVNVLAEETDGEISQYRAVSTGRLRNVSFELDKFITLETYFFDDMGHRAVMVWQAHDFLLINNLNYLIKDLYKIQWEPHLNTNKGSIELYEQAFSTQNRYGAPDAVFVDDPVLGSDNGNVIGT